MIKKVLTLMLGLVAAMCFTACSDDEPKDKTELITMWVLAETGITYHWGDDNKEHPIECMQVKYSPDGRWEPMTFGTIYGFEYEKGVEYELSVSRTTLSNPPADGSTYTYRLERIISYKVITANRFAALSKDWSSSLRWYRSSEKFCTARIIKNSGNYRFEFLCR